MCTCMAAGPDELPARILHNLSQELADMLCFIFQHSYDNSDLPRDWSVAIVVPAYKKDQRDNPVNYQTISLTCLEYKAMEHIVLSHDNKHLNTFNILTCSQYGFKKVFLCETQLILASDN